MLRASIILLRYSTGYHSDMHPGAFFNSQEGLHIHFSVRNGDIRLETIKFTMVLYGPCDLQVEKWHPIGRRDHHGCERLRVGIEKAPSMPKAKTSRGRGTHHKHTLRPFVSLRTMRRCVELSAVGSA
jgi:hypothetical protein